MAARPKKTHTCSEPKEVSAQNEQDAHSSIEDSTDILVLLNGENIITYVTLSITSMLGYAPEEIVGSHAPDLVHSDDLAILQQVLDETAQTPGENLTAEYRLRCKDGSWEWFEGSITNLLSVPGVGAIIASFRSITEQKVILDETVTTLDSSDEQLKAVTLLQQKASGLEAEIAEREQTEIARFQLAAIVESSEDAILSKDLNGIITSWNGAAERMYGYSVQEMVGQSVTLLFLPDRQYEFMQIMDRIRRGERIDHFETVRVRKDGILLNVSVTISPLKDNTGTIIGASTIARNITEQKRLEARSQQLFDSNLVGVFVSDFSGTFLDANDAFLDLLGYTRAELRAGVLERDTLTPPEFHFLSQNAVNALQETGSSGTYEKEYLHKSGKRIPVLVAVTRIDQITNICIGFVLDISERKELDKRKDEFISIASHELKTPVTSLKGFLSLLQRRLTAQGDERALHYLTRMDAQINKLIKLINDLLDLSKMQTGQLIYREERFEMDVLVQEVVENIQETTQTHSLQLEVQVQAQVFGDRDRIGQVLINLLNNAIKYSYQADTILVRVAKDHDAVHISVQDFGIGIAEEYQQKIFERFYQVTDAEEQTYPGLGIGLYISCEIVKRHGGKMWVESKKGYGATFHFTLPLIFAHSALLP